MPYFVFASLYVKSLYDTDLVDPHLPEGEAHPLLHVGPLLVLLLQHVAGQERGGGHGVVLLKRS